MGLEDFDKIDNTIKKDKKEKFVGDIEFDDFVHYIYHIDELIELVKDNYNKYINAKLRHDFKKASYQTTINWTDENNMRVANGFPKLTNQDQKNAAIDMKCRYLKNDMNEYEMKYKFYNKIFTFITNNFELLHDMYELTEVVVDDSEN